MKRLLQPITGRLRKKFSQLNSLSAHKQFALKFEMCGKSFHPRQRFRTTTAFHLVSDGGLAFARVGQHLQKAAFSLSHFSSLSWSVWRVIQFTQYQSMGTSFLNGFGLRAASGASEAQAERRREWSRSATPPPSRRRKPAADTANPLPLVTRARFVQRNGRGREGDGADLQPVERSIARVGHGG